MRKVYHGAVTTGDAYRCSSTEQHGAVFIGGIDIVEDLYEEFPNPVTVEINGEVVTKGLVTGELGWGYSSWTAVDHDVLRVTGDGDPYDLCAKLDSLQGDVITMTVYDLEGESHP